MGKRDFREQVTIDMLIDRVVPPFRPPRTDQAALAIVAAVLFFSIMLGTAILARSGAIAWLVFLVLGVSAVAGGVWWHKRASARRKEYVSLHKEAREVAYRLLTDKEDNRGARMRMNAYAEDLLKLQEPERQGTTWIFVWWDS